MRSKDHPHSASFGLPASIKSFLSRQSMISTCLLIIALQAFPAYAANFQIQPTSLELGGSVKSGAFSVINGGNEKLNVQISAKEWFQDAEGKDVFEEAKDLVFFPKIMTVEPNEQRAIRIGVKVPAALQEKTFRLFVEEIPSPQKNSDGKQAGKITAGLTIAFRFSTPIFVKPVQPKESGIIEKIGMSGGAVKATIKNAGNVHFKLMTVTFSGKAIDGKELFSKEVAGWYVLHGKSRPFEVVVPQEFCGSLATIDVAAKAENFTIDGTLNVQKNMCSH